MLIWKNWPNFCSFTRAGLVLVFAGTAQHAMALDLSGAYTAALGQDAGIRAARAAAEAGQERLPQARSQWFPNVSLTGSRNRNSLDANSPNALGVEVSNHSDYFSQNQTLAVRQSVLNRAKWADYSQASFQVADSDAVLARELQLLATRVGEAYFGCLLAEDQVTLLLSQERMTRAQLDAAQKTFIAGAGVRTDIDEVQARLDMNAAQLLEARQNVDYAHRQLGVLINQPVNQLAALDLSLLTLKSPALESVEEWQKNAEQSSPEIAALQARKETARLQVIKNQAAHLPTLDLVVQRSISSSEHVTQLNTTYNTHSVGVQWSVPLYSGGYVNSSVRQALAEEVRAQELLEGLRRDLQLRVHREFRGVTEGVLKVRALEQSVRSAEQMVVSSRKSAQAGSRTQLDVLKADALRVEALRDLAQARYIYLLSSLRLSVLGGATGQKSIDEINANLFK